MQLSPLVFIILIIRCHCVLVCELSSTRGINNAAVWSREISTAAYSYYISLWDVGRSITEKESG